MVACRKTCSQATSETIPCSLCEEIADLRGVISIAAQTQQLEAYFQTKEAFYKPSNLTEMGFK